MGLRERIREGWLAPMVAAMVAGLVIASAWVVRLSAGVQELSETATRAVTGGAAGLELVDDLEGTPLLGELRMAPGQAVSRCIVVQSRAVTDPSPVLVHVEALGDVVGLADHLAVSLAAGPVQPGSAATACEELEPTTVRTDQLDVLLRDLRPGGPGWEVTDPDAGQDAWWYRVDVTLDEDAPIELSGRRLDAVSLRWSSSAPSLADRTISERTSAFLAGVAQDALVPTVALGVAIIVFLGLHRRIDGSDPKLALAPVDHREVEFPERE